MTGGVMFENELALWKQEVKEKLTEKQWTQADLAKIVGVTPSMISILLKSNLGSDELRLKVSKALNVKSNWKKFK